MGRRRTTLAAVCGVLLLLGLPAAAGAAPRALITSGPQGTLGITTATVSFAATDTVLLGSFSCRLDGGSWAPCISPVTYDGLGAGAHTFEVRLQGLGADAVPALAQWVVELVAPVVTPVVPKPKPKPRRRGCRDADARPGLASSARLARAFGCLLARARRARHLQPFRNDARLRRAAAIHARDMVEHRFFGHVSSGGRSVVDRARAAGYLAGARAWTVLEALHWGEGDRATPRRALAELLRSPRHRAILLSRRLRDAGVAVTTYIRRGSGRPAADYVIDAGRRR